MVPTTAARIDISLGLVEGSGLTWMNVLTADMVNKVLSDPSSATELGGKLARLRSQNYRSESSFEETF